MRRAALAAVDRLAATPMSVAALAETGVGVALGRVVKRLDAEDRRENRRRTAPHAAAVVLAAWKARARAARDGEDLAAKATGRAADDEFLAARLGACGRWRDVYELVREADRRKKERFRRNAKRLRVGRAG